MTVGSSSPRKHVVLKGLQETFPGKFRKNIPRMRQAEQFSRAVPFHTDLILSFVAQNLIPFHLIPQARYLTFHHPMC